MDRFKLAPRLFEEIAAHALECYPKEACGIIAGARRDVGAELYRGRNLSPTPCVAFELDPETLSLQLDFEDVGLEMTAIYHSHPDGPETPSPIDVSRTFQGYPESVLIVCSLADVSNPVQRAFRFACGQVFEVSLVQDHELGTLTNRSPGNTLPGKELAVDLPF
jgi:proteasome lid subunit RPN8/RPN11